MTATWLCSNLIVWGVVPNVPFPHALAIEVYVTPTNPVFAIQ
jgi:NhaP-type Na+/H+ or K+/H+ antiporter